MLVTISKTVTTNGEALPIKYKSGQTTQAAAVFQKPTEESIGISLEDAKRLVQEKVDKMGITDSAIVTGWDYAVCTNLET